MQPRSWHSHYEPGVPPDLPPPEQPFHALVEAAAAAAPTFPALELFGRRTSYADLDAAAEKVARRLRAEPDFAPGA